MLKRVMSRFFIEFFCLAIPKNFAGQPFCAVFQKVSGSENVYGRERGSIKNFRRIFFCLTVPKIFAGEPFRVSLISGIEKFFA